MTVFDPPADLLTRTQPASQRSRADLRVGVWLTIVALMVFAIILVGGATRLTDSGLSITEWKPIHGVIPPLNAADWAAEFDLYRAIPEYQIQNKGMSLAEFQFIYWWEWGHRLLGRLIGLALLVPLVVFWATKQLRPAMGPVLAVIVVLVGVQGAIGWWMVSSGLGGDRLDVAAYRLATHLSMAFLVFCITTWVALDHLAPRVRAGDRRVAAAAILALLALSVQVVMGAFVAGTDAGFVYNDWPTIGGHWLPQGYAALEPFSRNLVENHEAIQFNHRIGAYVAALAVGWLAWTAWRSGQAHLKRAAGLALGLTLAQVVLGVATLMGYGIWTPPQIEGVLLGVGHQGLGALVLLSVALTLRLARPLPGLKPV
jgi:heme a synthase